MVALVVDDEAPARELMVHYLEQVEQITSILEAENGFEALKLLQLHTVDVLLLDIQMPKLNGFEMLELLDNPPAIIFCTAYDTYAIQAFEKNAVDYLLKPFSKQRLFEALTKLANQPLTSQIKNLTAWQPMETPLERIVVKMGKEINIVPVANVLYLKAADDYVELYTATKKYLKNKRLKYYESALNKKEFVRVHRQYIVRVSAIVKLDKWGKESYLAQLTNGDTVTISASGYGNLQKLLDL